MSRWARILFFAVYILVGLGIVMTYSASAIFAERAFGNPVYFLLRQSAYAAAGTVFLFLTALIPAAFWKRYARGLILFAIALLVLVFIPVIGRSAGGAKRWIGFAFFNFQPVEFAKIAVCVYLSDYLTRKIKIVKKGRLAVFLPPMILLGSVIVLLLLQPDLGSCFIIVVIAVLLFFLVGIPARYILAAGTILPAIFYFLVIRVPYRMNRIVAYLNPWEDPQGSGFQMIQSLISFGLGGIHGVGLGQGAQKLFYLPSAHNDFIFSVIAEELGLIGVLFVLGLYLVFFVAGFQIARRARTDFEKLLAIALILLVTLQAVINMCVSAGLIPTKGLPLPFVSYGGTSIVFNLMILGMILRIDRKR